MMDMKWMKKLPPIMGISSIVSFVGALLLFIFVVPNANATYKTVIGFMIASLLLIVAALMAFYWWVSRDAEPNFFLFDRTKKRNVPVENLTFKMVNERMSFYLTMVCESPEQLWETDVLERDRLLGYRRVYRPLLAYKMLYDLADKDIAAYWDLLIRATPATVNSLCGALEQGGEKDMVTAFRYIMENYRNNPEKIKDFVCCNSRYIRSRMLGYIKKNIEYFY